MVDDDAQLLRSLERVLRRDAARWDITFALGGAAAALRLREQVFDVVVSDFDMGSMMGSDVFAVAAESSPAALRIMLTSCRRVTRWARTMYGGAMTAMLRLVIVMLLASCGGAPLTYPVATCSGNTKAPDECKGRITQLALIKRDDGNAYFADLGREDPATRAPYLYRIVCIGCPFHVGETYLARMRKGEEHVYGIMLDGQEITPYAMTRTDRLTLMQAESYTCESGPGPQHWEDNNGVTCKPGARPGGGFARARPHGSVNCSPTWPGSLVRQLAGTSRVKINVQLSSSYTLKDPDLAHEVFPGLFVRQLNGLGIQTTDHSFELADGLPTLYFRVVFDQDETGDHYGMTVTVSGPKDLATLKSGGDTTTLFAYTVPTVYTTAEKLTKEAAVKAYEMLYFPGGWNCDDDGARPIETLEHWCKARPNQSGPCVY
jgi:hypothetical protein